MEDNIPGFPGYHISKGRLKVSGKDNPMYGVHRFGIESPNASLSLRKVRRIDRLKLRGNTNRYIALKG